MKESSKTKSLTALSKKDPKYAKLVDSVKKILSALGVEYGFSHTEVLLTPQNEVKLLEVNLRPAGLEGYINDVVYSHKGFNQYTLAHNSLNNIKTKEKRDDEAYVIWC